uniref:Uncharacterized protein n=1 Tax=Chrysotila carterae TaxID=13221 RepID=A0A7S4EWC1_CHRCT|mmetsp:Transcript_5246/g.11398  ORF Transcript_5246/g.11398 Transcript_5246/m.11398 type:complete len:128 (-) Transcript_5246:20-403(-)
MAMEHRNVRFVSSVLGVLSLASLVWHALLIFPAQRTLLQAKLDFSASLHEERLAEAELATQQLELAETTERERELREEIARLRQTRTELQAEIDGLQAQPHVRRRKSSPGHPRLGNDWMPHGLRAKP